jgi:CHAT domain-containing protein
LKAGFDNLRQWAWAQRVRLLGAAGRHAEAIEATEGARARAFLDLLAARQLVGSGAPESSGPLQSPVTTAPPSLADIASHAARLRSTVLAYWVERDAVRIWAVDGTGRVGSAVRAIDQRRLEQLVRASWARNSARARAADSLGRGSVQPGAGAAGDGPGALRELYALLIAPISDALPPPGSRRLTIVPHGPLFRVSFGALRAPSGRYLLEDYELHYTPSIGVLAATSRMTGDRAREGALVIAAPRFGRAASAEGLVPLPESEREGRAVASLIGARSGTLLLGARATEAEVVRQAGAQRVLHFATHAVVSDDHPLDSFLALAGAGGDSETKDGRLTTEEVYGLRLAADLVVLSACRTAGGRVTGDGISGLTRAFVFAGSPSVVATLADLPDVAGAYALPRFYRAWISGRDKARALRTAQLALLQALRAGDIAVDTPAGRFVLPEHPSFWSALVLIGEP